MLTRLLKKWATFHCLIADNRNKPLVGSQATFAVRTIKAALNGKMVVAPQEKPGGPA